jgi:hypothetical protein
VPHQLSRVAIVVTSVVLALAGCGTSAPSGTSGAPATGPLATGRSAFPTTLGGPSAQVATFGVTCAPAGIVVTLVSDRTDYRAGEPVTFTATATNSGASPCDLPTGICLPQIQIADGAGTLVWDRAATVVVCQFGTPVPLAPGAAAAQTIVWDGMVCSGRTPESCPGQPAPAGTYTPTANWNGASASTTFMVAG